MSETRKFKIQREINALEKQIKYIELSRMLEHVEQCVKIISLEYDGFLEQYQQTIESLDKSVEVDTPRYIRVMIDRLVDSMIEYAQYLNND